MCYMTDTFYGCKHWGIPQVETPCAKGFSSQSKSGCEDNVTVGTQRIDSLCPACTYRASLTGTLNQTSTQNSYQSSAFSSQTPFSQPEQHQVQQHFRITHRVGNTVKPLTRGGIEKRPLTLAKQTRINQAVKVKKAAAYLPKG